MTDDNLRRLNRLAARAEQLDDMIQKAAQMQKKIVDALQELGKEDKLKQQRMTRTRRSRKRASSRNT